MWRSDERVLSLHPWLPLVTATASLAMGLFPIWLALSAAPAAAEKGRLPFISDGMDAQCGVNAVVMGVGGTLLTVALFVAAAHAGSQPLVYGALLFGASWQTMLGVAGTGWAVHNAALAVAMVDVLWFHWTLSGMDPWRRQECAVAVHRLGTAGAGVCGFIFAVGWAVRRASGDEASGDFRLAYSLSCVVEYVLVFFLTCANLCLANGLNVCLRAHLIFDDAAVEP